MRTDGKLARVYTHAALVTNKETKILRESSALSATRGNDGKISTLHAELFTSTRVPNISPLYERKQVVTLRFVVIS